MNRLHLLGLIACFSLISLAQAQNNIKSPGEFMGYAPGDKFSFHHEVVDYFEYVAANSPEVALISYGKTNEGRPLMLAVVSSAENIRNLDQIRKNNLIKIGLSNGSVEGKHLPFVWLGFNIHGNEASCTNAAAPTLYALLNREKPEMQQWLEETMIIIDPCINPDGYARYVNWYRQKRTKPANVHSNTWEHDEPWPGGRYNHYLLDLNRDWAWQSQIESQQRIKIYNQWMPHVLVDFHEMGYNSPYFFAPPAKPQHKDVSPWQKEFQRIIGKNHALRFDEQQWLYYSSEVFDLLYPSYGDTWPTFNGAMGYTHEQGGGGRAGIEVQMENKDTLRLWDRYMHHKTSALSTVETAFNNRERLLSEFVKYFDQAQNNPTGPYKTYVIKNKDQNGSHTLSVFMDHMDKLGIQYGYPTSASNQNGFSYRDNKDVNVKVESDDIVISAYQPKGKLVKVLFEPKTDYEDSLTYDLTAWALPYAYDLEAYALSGRLNPKSEKPNFEWDKNQDSGETYAYIAEWKDLQDARFLGDLLEEGIQVRYANKAFSIEGASFDRGSLLINLGDNPQKDKDVKTLVKKIADQNQISLKAVKSGLVDSGIDFGSNNMILIQDKKIALVGGEGVSPTAMGEIWHYFEQNIHYPVYVISPDVLERGDLEQFDAIILPSGRYNRASEELMSYVSQGGKVIAFESAIRTFSASSKTNLGRRLKKQMEAEKSERNKNDKLKDDKLLKKYGERDRERLTERVEGAIYKIYLDESHPLAFGKKDITFSIKRNRQVYPYMAEGGWNIGYYKADSHVSGFVGYKLKAKLPNSLAIGVENYGRGSIVYFVDSPIFRSFWYGGKLILANAVFFVE